MENKTYKSVKAKIVAISNEIRVTKEGKNTFQGFQYFKPDDIMKALNPLLQKYNLICIFDMEYSKEIEMYKGELRIEGTETPAKEWIVYKFDIPLTQVKGAGQAQNAGATQTYCKRYMLMNAFNFADNSIDPDSKGSKPIESDDPLEKRRIAKVEELKGMLNGKTVRDKLIDLNKRTGLKVRNFNITERNASLAIASLLNLETKHN